MKAQNTTVYILVYDDGYEEDLTLGVFATRAEADAAIEQSLRDLVAVHFDLNDPKAQEEIEHEMKSARRLFKMAEWKLGEVYRPWV